MAHAKTLATTKTTKKSKGSIKKSSTRKVKGKGLFHKIAKPKLNFKKQLKALGFKSVFDVVVMDREAFQTLHGKAFDNSSDTLQFYNWAVYVANYAVQQVREDAVAEKEGTV